MNKTESVPRSILTSITTNSAVLILIVLLLTLLVVGSGYGILYAQSQLSSTQLSIDSLDGVTTDLTKLGQVSGIISDSSLAFGDVTNQARAMLATMNKDKCCNLDSNFAVSSLDWLGHIATVLAGEKTQITDMTFNSDMGKHAQADAASAYLTHENLVKKMSELIVDWNSHFDADREQRLQAAADAVAAAEPVFTNMQSNLAQTLKNQRQQQDSVSVQRQQLVNSLTAWHAVTYVAAGGVVLGVVLLVALFVYIYYSGRHARRARPVHTGVKSHPTRSLPEDASIRKHGKHK
jgi:hypothetical protein